ncbi:hypothetical protein LguiB_002283 [Lonicera macranthoides]
MSATSIHFVLVHGSCHGGWCWYKVTTLLESAGHTVTAVDLGASGINPKQLSDIPTYSSYLQPLADVLEALPSGQKVALVGHSMGGLSISVAMEMFPSKIAIAIYCTAIMPRPNNFDLLQLNQQEGEFTALDEEELGGIGPTVVVDLTGSGCSDDEDGSWMWEMVMYYPDIQPYGDSKYIFDSSGTPTAIYFGPNFMATMMYQLSPHEDLTLGLSLTRYYPIYRDETSRAENKFTSANYGSVNRAYIISEQDEGITIAIQQQYITDFPPKEVQTISDSDHMLMLSQPQKLVTYLQEIATKYV